MVLNFSDFQTLLVQEQVLAEALNSLLNQEQNALSNDDLESLESLQKHKKTALADLQQQAQQRLQWLEQHQLPISAQCLLEFSQPQQEKLQPLWSQLEEIYQQNQQLSARLSDMVLILRHRTQNKINILHGKTKDTTLYNQQGLPHGAGLGKQSIQA